MEGLLHLGAVSALAGSVYLNLDKAALDHNEWLKRLDSLRKEIKLAIGRLDQKPTMGDGAGTIPSPSFRTADAGFLLFVAGEPYTHYKGALAWGVFWMKWTKAPGLPYFMKGWHSLPVTVLTMCSWLCFFFLVWINTAHWHLTDWLGVPWNWVHFSVFMSTAVWVLINSSLSHTLTRLGDRCQTLIEKLNDQIKADIVVVTQPAVTDIDEADRGIGRPPEAV